MESKQRNRILGAIEGLCAYFVVMIHVRFPGEIGTVLAQIFNFSVPFFFSVSGYFYYHADSSITLKQTKRKICHLIPMAIFAELVYFLYGAAFQIRAYGLKIDTLISYIINIIHEYEVSKIFIPAPLFAGVCWFIYQLIICYAVVHLLIREKLDGLFGYLIPILLVGGQIICYLLYQKYGFYPAWNLLRFPLFMGVPYFLLGYEIRERIEIRKNAIHKLHFGILTAIGVLIILLQRMLWDHGGHYIGQFFIVLDCWLLSVKWKDCKATSVINALDYAGENYSLFIYLFHLPVFWFTEAVLEKKIPDLTGNVLWAWSSPIVACILATVVAMIIRFCWTRVALRVSKHSVEHGVKQ